MGNTTTLSSAVELSRVNAMGKMFAILGQCITQFFTDATAASVIFDLETVRSKLQTFFMNGIKASGFKTIAKRTFLITDTIDTNVDGMTDLGFYLAAQKGDAPDNYTLITTTALTNKIITISDFVGDTANNFLSVVNLSTTLKGHYMVDL